MPKAVLDCDIVSHWGPKAFVWHKRVYIGRYFWELVKAACMEKCRDIKFEDMVITTWTVSSFE